MYKLQLGLIPISSLAANCTGARTPKTKLRRSTKFSSSKVNCTFFSRRRRAFARRFCRRRNSRGRAHESEESASLFPLPRPRRHTTRSNFVSRAATRAVPSTGWKFASRMADADYESSTARRFTSVRRFVAPERLRASCPAGATACAEPRSRRRAPRRPALNSDLCAIITPISTCYYIIIIIIIIITLRRGASLSSPLSDRETGAHSRRDMPLQSFPRDLDMLEKVLSLISVVT